jgi:hypothetical protein
MKNVLILFFCGLAFLFGTGELQRWFSTQKIEKEQPVIDQKQFAIVLYLHNGSNFCARMLRSIFDQNYEDFRVLVIDDASEDHTFECAQRICLEEHQERVMILRNEVPLGFEQSLMRAIALCSDQEIIVPVSGWLAHEEVLPRLNELFQNPDLWMIENCPMEYPCYRTSDRPSLFFYAGMVRSCTGIKDVMKIARGHRARAQEPLVIHPDLCLR